MPEEHGLELDTSASTCLPTVLSDLGGNIIRDGIVVLKGSPAISLDHTNAALQQGL